MKTGKKIRIALQAVLGFVFLLFAVLIIHIAIMVKGAQPLVNSTEQMARADFSQPVDSSDAIKIENEVKSLNGVKSVYFNLKDYILIYTFDNRVNNAQKIYDHAIRNSGFSAIRYVVSGSELSKGCPVMNDHSFYGKLTTIISKIVN